MPPTTEPIPSAADEAQHQHDVSRSALDSLPAEIVVLDAAGDIVSTNRAWREARRGDARAPWEVGDSYLARWEQREDLTRAVRDDVAAGVRAVMERRRPNALVTYQVPATGRWFELCALPLRDSSGGVVMTHVDVTDHKLVEAQLQQAQKMEAIGQLAGGVAHDFNNLLTAIGGYADMVYERVCEQDPAGALADLEQLQRSAGRAGQLVNQLLAYSRRQPTQTSAVDLSATVAGLRELLGRLIGAHIEVVTTLRPVGHVEVNDTQLEHVVINLALNARDAMPHGGRLDIATADVYLDEAPAEDLGLPSGSYVELRVSDTGTGMAPEVLANVFEPFFTTKDPGVGTGLGLPMVYGCVTQAGGLVSIDTAPGSGTSVRVLLPRSAEPSAMASATAAPEPRAGGGTILLVEDQPQVRELLCASLRRLGYEVLGAGDGREALALVEDGQHGIDLLLTDVVMPHVNGPELAERLHATRTQEMAVLFMSGYTRDIAVPLDGGAAFLQKPFSLGELAAAVRAAMAGAQSPQAPDQASASAPG